jgi:biotin carboxyl carrier protein
VTEDDVPSTTPKPSRGMSRTQKILFFATGWLIVLMPFLFWWNTWFGRHLSDQQLTEYLHDDKKPRHIQQALVQISERISHNDAAVKQWYPDLQRLATDPVEEVRNTDAWVMGQDTSGAGFHEMLLRMLNDVSATVRGNAALSLVRFGDATGRPQIVALLQPAEVRVPTSGQIGPSAPQDLWSDKGRTAGVVDTAAAGIAIREGGVVAKLGVAVFTGGASVIELHSPITGRVRTLETQRGRQVHAGDLIAVIDPGTEQVWEALRALYVVGQMDDLAAVRPYERELPEISNDVRLQAAATEKAIRSRAGVD